MLRAEIIITTHTMSDRFVEISEQYEPQTIRDRYVESRDHSNHTYNERQIC